MPAWIAAHDPLALKTAGEHADGVVLQIAEPGLCLGRHAAAGYFFSV